MVPEQPQDPQDQDLPLEISFIQSLEDIPAAAWNACAGDKNPFVSYEFLHALEASGSVGEDTGWMPYHMVLRAAGDGNKKPPMACMPLYLKNHSYGEYVFDHGWADAFERAGGRYYPKAQSSVPFTPAAAPKLLINFEHTLPQQVVHIQRALLDGLRQITDRLSLSSAHLTFLPESEANVAENMDFLIRHDQQFHWQNEGYGTFDDFLAGLSSRKRKQIRKERRTVAQSDIDIRVLTGSDIKESHWDAFFHFYMDSGARKWGQPYLTRAFFSEIGETLRDKIVLIMCLRGGREIAGALNFLGSDTIYGRQWGCIEDHPCLHFEACYYQAIDYAIAKGLSTVEAGAQGPHKLARGYIPVQTTSAHYIANPSFRDAVERYLVDERRGIAAEIEFLKERSPFKKTD